MRDHLAEGRRLAEICGATPVVERARVELSAAGDRVRGRRRLSRQLTATPS